MQELLIVWTDINDTGIAIIDQQHRGIVSIINSLFFSIRHEQGNRILASSIDMIGQYTKIHFATEEKILRMSNYPAFDSHKKLHDNLISRSLTTGNESRRYHDPLIYLDFLKKWWIEHINGQDRLYVEHLRNYMAAAHEIHAPAGFLHGREDLK